MKKWIVALMMASVLSACASSTDYGECIGINGLEKPNLRYQYSARNIVVGLLSIETLVIPVFVLFDYIKCPVAVKEKGV